MGVNDSVVVNVWDDYSEDDLSQQNTYAYVENQGFSDEQCAAILQHLLPLVRAWAVEAGSPVMAELVFHDSALVYPHLVGTEQEWCLFKRWELKLEKLSHPDREALLDYLREQDIRLDGVSVNFISES